MEGDKNEILDIPALKDVLLEINSKYSFRMNTVKNIIEFKVLSEDRWEIFSDSAYSTLYLKLLQKFEKLKESNLRHLINSDFLCEKFNPFHDYFKSLSKWDGSKDHIDQLIDVLKIRHPEKKEYVYKCLFRWFIGVSGSIVEENIYNETAIVLVGKQGIGKTRFANYLVPNRLKDYFYSGNFRAKGKDGELNLTRCLIINLDEFEEMNKSELKMLKSFMTKNSINLRPPFGKRSLNFPRHASFIGSVDKPEFLTDSAGNRRFLTIELDGIDLDALNFIDMDLIYGQALSLFQNGESHWFKAEEIAEINSINSDYRKTFIEEEYFLKYLRFPTDLEIEDQSAHIKKLTATEICELLKSYKTPISVSNATVQRMGSVLNQIRGKDHRKKVNGRFVWKVVEKNSNVESSSID